MKTRQITFRQMGGGGYARAQRLAYALRSKFDTKSQAYYAADQGSIPSPAGSWADTPYVLTNAPLPLVRKLAQVEGLTL